MKNISTLLSVLSLALIGVLYYLHFSHTEKTDKKLGATAAAVEKSAGGMTIAYFEMDSVEKSIHYVTDAKDKFKSKEQQLSTQLEQMKNNFQKKIADWEKRGATMTQAENESVQKEYAKMNEEYLGRKQNMEMELQDLQHKTASEVNKKIEDFLKDYNKQKGFSYIMTSQPGFIYFKDTVYNITNDVIAGLNAEYKGAKKK